MYRCPLRKESSSIPIRRSPSSGSPCRTRSSATTRSMIRPTVYQLIRISSQTAVFEQCVASHATCCSNARVNRLPCRAHGTRDDHDPVAAARRPAAPPPRRTPSSLPDRAPANGGLPRPRS